MGACLSSQDDAQKQQRQQRTTHTRRPSQRHLHPQAILPGDVASQKGTSSRRGLHRKGKSVGQALDGSVGGIGVTDAQFAETLSLRLGGVDLAAAARREQQALEEGDASSTAQQTWAKPSSRTPREGEGLLRVSSRKGIGLSAGGAQEAVSAAPLQDQRLSSLKKGRHTRSSSSPAVTLRLLVPPPDGGGEQGLGSSRASPHRPSGFGGRVLGLGNSAGGGGGVGGGGSGSPRHSAARRGGHSRSNSVSRAAGMVVRASEEEDEAVNAAVAAVVASGAANVSGLLDEMLLRNNTPSPPPSTAMELRGAQLLSTPSSRAAMAKTAEDLTRAMEPVVVVSPNDNTAAAALLTPPSPLPASAHAAGSSSLAPPSPLHFGGDGTSPVSPVSPAIPSSVLLGLGLNSGRSRPRGLQPGGLAQQIMQRNAVEAYISTATASFKDREQNKEGSPLSRTTTHVHGVPVPLTPLGELPPSLAHVTLLRPPSATRSASDQQTPINHSRSMGSLRGNSFMSFLGGGASSGGNAQQSPDPAAALQRRLDAQLVLMGAEQGGSSRTLLTNSAGPESGAGAPNDNNAAAAAAGGNGNGIGSLRGRSRAAGPGTPKSAHTRSVSVDVASLRNSMAASRLLLQLGSDSNDEKLPSTEQLWEHYAGGASATHLSKKGLHQLSEDVFEEFCARYRADLQQQAEKRGRKDYTTEQREADLARELPFLLPTPKSSRPATPSKAATIAAAAAASSPNSPEEAAAAQEAARIAAMLRRDAHVSFIYKYCLLNLKKSAGSRVATAVNETLDGGLGSLKLSGSMASLHRRNKSHGGILQTGVPGSPKTLSRSPSSASLSSDDLVTKLEFAVGWPACYTNLFAPLDETTGATAMAAKQGSPCRLM